MRLSAQNGRLDWDAYFINIAKAVSLRGDCTRRQVGAVIVKDHRIIATGYNGRAAGVEGCINAGCPGRSGVEPCDAIHAEANAVIYGDRWLMQGSTIYVTDWPCKRCFDLINAAGITRVVKDVHA